MRLMESVLMFDDPAARDGATPELIERGYGIELLLDAVDEHEGVVLTPSVWIKVTGPYAGSEDEFFAEMHAFAQQFNGELCEAGLADPLPQQ